MSRICKMGGVFAQILVFILYNHKYLHIKAKTIESLRFRSILIASRLPGRMGYRSRTYDILNTNS